MPSKAARGGPRGRLPRPWRLFGAVGVPVGSRCRLAFEVGEAHRAGRVEQLVWSEANAASVRGVHAPSKVVMWDGRSRRRPRPRRSPATSAPRGRGATGGGPWPRGGADGRRARRHRSLRHRARHTLRRPTQPATWRRPLRTRPRSSLVRHHQLSVIAVSSDRIRDPATRTRPAPRGNARGPRHDIDVADRARRPPSETPDDPMSGDLPVPKGKHHQYTEHTFRRQRQAPSFFFAHEVPVSNRPRS